MVVGVLRVELILHAPQSLKEKRSIVQKIVGRCRSRFPISAAETGLHDLWQRSEIGFCMVAGDEAAIHTVFLRIQDEIARIGLAEVGDLHQEYLHF
jgi:uncharacterized protein YlxP (DUF503 family)